MQHASLPALTLGDLLRSGAALPVPGCFAPTTIAGRWTPGKGGYQKENKRKKVVPVPARVRCSNTLCVAGLGGLTFDEPDLASAWRVAAGAATPLEYEALVKVWRAIPRVRRAPGA